MNSEDIHRLALEHGTTTDHVQNVLGFLDALGIEPDIEITAPAASQSSPRRRPPVERNAFEDMEVPVGIIFAPLTCGLSLIPAIARLARQSVH